MRTYGNLRLTTDGKSWEMSALEPHVAIRMKQLFPRVPKQSVGPFYFPNDTMHCADLQWFMDRYPLATSEDDRQALRGGKLEFDVGLQLPKVSRVIEYVNYDAKTVQSIEELARSLAIRATTGTFVERGQASRELDVMVRQATGVSKAKAVAQFVRMLVQAGEPVLLAGWHRAVYDIWLSDLADLRPAMYTGSETAAQKAKEKKRFLDGETDVMIISLRSGAGLDDLQHRCSVVVMGELDWSPGVHQQIIWRVDRDGQKNPVMAFFLVTNDGSDPPVMDVLGIKASEATQIVDPYIGAQKVDDETTNLRRLVDRYIAKAAKQENSPNLVPEPLAPVQQEELFA